MADFSDLLDVDEMRDTMNESKSEWTSVWGKEIVFEDLDAARARLLRIETPVRRGRGVLAFRCRTRSLQR